MLPCQGTCQPGNPRSIGNPKTTSLRGGVPAPPKPAPGRLFLTAIRDPRPLHVIAGCVHTTPTLLGPRRQHRSVRSSCSPAPCRARSPGPPECPLLRGAPCSSATSISANNPREPELQTLDSSAGMLQARIARGQAEAGP